MCEPRVHSGSWAQAVCERRSVLVGERAFVSRRQADEQNEADTFTQTALEEKQRIDVRCSLFLPRRRRIKVEGACSCESGAPRAEQSCLWSFAATPMSHTPAGSDCTVGAAGIRSPKVRPDISVGCVRRSQS